MNPPPFLVGSDAIARYYGCMPMPIVQSLSTPRLTLRPFVPTDRDMLLTLQGDPEVMRYYGNGEALAPAQIDLVLEAHVHFREKSYWAWAISLKDDPTCIGQVTAGVVDRSGEQWIELCWLLVPGRWRKGYGSEAVKGVIDHGIANLGWQKIMASSDLRNEASLRLMSKCGLAYTREEMGSHGRMVRVHTLEHLPDNQNPVYPIPPIPEVVAAMD